MSTPSPGLSVDLDSRILESSSDLNVQQTPQTQQFKRELIPWKDIPFSLLFIIMHDIVISLIIKADLGVITDIFLSPPHPTRESPNLANFVPQFF